jgi:prepilin-type N-terminal cleavage/methylation domain-containing protein
MTIADRSHIAARHRGFTMIEIAVTSLMLAIAMTATMRCLGWVAAERRAVERRQCAVEEVANLMERLAARPWGRLTPGPVDDLKLSEPAREKLPGAELTVMVDDQAGSPGARRLSVRLKWRARNGEWEAPARLTAWTSRRRDDR